MSLFDRFLEVMRLNPEDEDDIYDYEFEMEDEVPVIKKNSRKDRREADYDEPRTGREKSKSASKITPMRPVRRQGSSGMEVCAIKPATVEDAREITETLLSNRTVILNVEGLDIGIAQRIIDFTAGSCFAINGNLQKISSYIFVISPPSVDLSGDFQNILDSFHNSGLHMDI